jgi:hypothetical protein
MPIGAIRFGSNEIATVRTIAIAPPFFVNLLERAVEWVLHRGDASLFLTSPQCLP